MQHAFFPRPIAQSYSTPMAISARISSEFCFCKLMDIRSNARLAMDHRALIYDFLYVPGSQFRSSVGRHQSWRQETSMRLASGSRPRLE
jgi:hypothetical protein